MMISESSRCGQVIVIFSTSATGLLACQLSAPPAVIMASASMRARV
jgi:hypothetical protein